MHLIGSRFGHIAIGHRQCLLNLLTTAVAAVRLSANNGPPISDTPEVSRRGGDERRGKPRSQLD